MASGRPPSDRRHVRDESPRDIAGRAHALTVFTAMKPFWPLIHRILFAFTAIFRRRALAGLTKLSFIYFAEWSYVRLDRTQLLFQSNFAGSWAEYLDAFAYVIPLQTGSVWMGNYGFPGIKPATGFKDYAREHEVETAHYYCAYPDATTTDVLSALELARAAERFAPGDGDWLAEFERFLTDNQELL